MKAGRLRALPILVLPVARERDQSGGAQPRHFAQPSRKLIAVDLRQTDIEERDIGLKGFDPREWSGVGVLFSQVDGGCWQGGCTSS